jgi:hypothetical protein
MDTKVVYNQTIKSGNFAQLTQSQQASRENRKEDKNRRRKIYPDFRAIAITITVTFNPRFGSV